MGFLLDFTGPFEAVKRGTLRHFAVRAVELRVQQAGDVEFIDDILDTVYGFPDARVFVVFRVVRADVLKKIDDEQIDHAVLHDVFPDQSADGTDGVDAGFASDDEEIFCISSPDGVHRFAPAIHEIGDAVLCCEIVVRDSANASGEASEYF